MKLILSLILIFSIVLNLTNAVKIPGQKKLNDQQCFTNNVISSYNTEFSTVSYNANVKTSDDKINQISVYENGLIDVDYENQQMFIEYTYYVNKGMNVGKVWVFGSNNTQYYVPVNDNTGNCYTSLIEVSFSESLDIQYFQDIQIGGLQGEEFIVASSNFTQQALVVSKDDCSFITSSANNNYLGTPYGTVVSNFYNYQPKSNPNNYDLPQNCIDNPIIKGNMIYPTILESFQFLIK